MRKGRQIDRHWEIRRYKGDIALYAHCKCGFNYCCSSNKRNEDGSWSFEQYINLNKIFHYCPNCGAHKKWYSNEIKKINKFQWE